MSLTERGFFMRRVCSGFFLCALTWFLAGCGQLSPSIGSMSKAYQAVIERTERDSTLLNIVRASKSYPLSFVTIPSITGSGSAVETVGLTGNLIATTPNSAIGFISPTVGSGYAPALSLSLSSGFTFTQSSLDNAAFAKAFGAVVPLEMVQTALSQALAVADGSGPVELVLSLLIDSIEVTDSAGRTRVLRNNPLFNGYPDFQNELRQMIHLGLKVEHLSREVPFGGPMSGTQINEMMFKFFDAQDNKKLSVRRTSKMGREDGFQVYQAVSTSRFCFNRSEHAAEATRIYGARAVCDDPVDSKELLTSAKKSTTTQQVAIKVRSAREIFLFLGNVLAAQQLDPPVYSSIRGRDGSKTNDTNTTDIPILIVKKNQRSINPFVETEYEGDIYTIPSENAGLSTKTLSLLQNLLMVAKVPGAIPAAPSVLIK